MPGAGQGRLWQADGRAEGWGFCRLGVCRQAEGAMLAGALGHSALAGALNREGEAPESD